MTKTDTETLPAQIAKELGNALKAGKRTPLSVRQLAKDWQVAPGTVHKAMRLLCNQGILHAIPRKGFAPGKKTPIIADKADPLHKPPAETHADWLLSQFRSGQLDPFQPLPLLKELARIAGSAPPTITKSLRILQSRGILERRGRRWYWATTLSPRSRQALIVIQRCDRQGNLLLDTDREMAFIKACYAVSAQLRLPLRVLGWYDHGNSGELLRANGSRQDFQDLAAESRGFLVSTWLLPGTRFLLMRLAKSKIPLAVWWEHPRQLLRRYMPKGQAIAYFDLAFGKSPGTQVARQLLAQGATSVGFLSPFHAAEWSRKRWQGMTDLLQASGIPHSAFVENRFSSQPDLESQGHVLGVVVGALLSAAVSQQKLPNTLVCVNDQTAAIAQAWLRARQIHTRIVSFDNSDLSYRLRIDSYEFDTEGMVRGMIHAVLAPGKFGTSDREAYAQGGRLVEK